MPAEVETMMYVGETPWHGLGTRLDKVATSEEAIIAAGLDWNVELLPIEMIKGMTHTAIPDRYAVARETDGRVFYLSGKVYRPLQNRKAFEFFDEIVGEKLAIYHTAGSLKDGAIIWILAKLPKDLVIKNEQIEAYLLLSNNHDGTAAIRIFFTKIRVVCHNTLQMALNSAIGDRFYSRHTTNMMNRVDNVRKTLGLANAQAVEWKEIAVNFATKQLPAPQRPLLLKAAFTGNPETKDDEIWHPIQVAIAKANELITTGRGQDNPKIQGTKWQAYNGIVEYVDYFKNTRGNSQDNRLTSAWFGNGNTIKNRAWDYLKKN